MINPAFLVGLFGAWRVTDGGYHRHPLSTGLGWGLCLVIAWSALGPYDDLPRVLYATVIGAAFGRLFTKGYVDWDDSVEMLLRPSYMVVVIYVVITTGILFSIEATLLAVFMAIPIYVGNVIQPWLRAKLAHRGNWSNRTAEFVEGCCNGLAFWMVIAPSA